MVDEKDFFREATLRICGSLEIEKALWDCLVYIRQYIPADDDTLLKLNSNNQVIYRYCNENGAITESANPNGAFNNIAGICNASRNVFGMMPHPERASSPLLGNEDGKQVFQMLFNLS